MPRALRPTALLPLLVLLLAGCGVTMKDARSTRAEPPFVPPAGGLIVSADAGGSLTVIDAANRSKLFPILVSGTPRDIVGLENGAEVLVAARGAGSGRDALVRVDVRAKLVKESIALDVDGSVGGISLSPDKKKAAVIAEKSAEVLVVDLAAKSVSARIAFPGATLRDVVWMPDGRIAVAAGNELRTVREDGSDALAVPLAGPPIGLAVSPKGVLFAAVSLPPQLAIVEGAAVRVIDLPDAAGPSAVALAPDGARAFVADGGRAGTQGAHAFLVDLSGAAAPTAIRVGMQPRAVLVDGSGMAWIAASGASTVTALAPDGAFGVELPVGDAPAALAKVSAPERVRPPEPAPAPARRRR